MRFPAYLCLLFCIPAQAQNQPTPKDAWRLLHEHTAAISEMRSQYNGAISTVVMAISDAGPQFATGLQEFIDFCNLIRNQHRKAADWLWASNDGGVVSNIMRQTRTQFTELNAMMPQFLALAQQMESRRTPESEQKFLVYLKTFAKKMDGLDAEHFTFHHRDIAKFAEECELHGNATGRFGEFTIRGVAAYEARQQQFLAIMSANSEAGAKLRDKIREAHRQRKLLFEFFARWDANQTRYLAAVNVVKNDWRRIHEDSARLAVFLSSPDFVKDLPHIDASNATDALARISGYLDTYR